MTDMRHLIDLMESALPMVTDDTPLHGSLDIKGLIKYLPDVDDPTRFMTAMLKVRQGQTDNLTRTELGQLAKAFISLMRDEREETIKAMRKLAAVHAE